MFTIFSPPKHYLFRGDHTHEYIWNVDQFTSWWWLCWFFFCCFFSRSSPRYPPVTLNKQPLTVFTQMDAVMMCCDWDTDPPNILESDKIKFFGLNYIITKLPSVNTMLTLSLAGREADFWGKITEVSVRRADRCSDLFSNVNALWV